MTRTVLILGASGRLGRNAAQAFDAEGWTVRSFDRSGTTTLTDAAKGARVIVNGWNPPYSDWAAQIPQQTARIIEAARTRGAAVMLPGNVYVYGAGMPEVIGPGVAHAATNPLGRIRIEMEAAYRDAPIRTVVLRAGDFLDTAASGNWFDRIIAAKAARGTITYPGPLNRPHAWAFLPDLTQAFARLADRLDELPPHSDLAFSGHTLTGQGLTDACAEALGQPVTTKPMAWWTLRMAQPFWREAKHLIEMRYLWSVPHRLDGSALEALLPDLAHTALPDVMRQALQFQIDPDQPVI